MDNLQHKEEQQVDRDVEDLNPDQINGLIKSKATFVLNIVTAWCPDCTVRQASELPSFVSQMKRSEVEVYQCAVQKDRGIFLSNEHEELVESCGGHGYPRTVLFIKGTMVDNENVEVMTSSALNDLATVFTRQVFEA